MQVSANLEGLGAYVGTVGGFLDAVGSPGFEGNFMDHLLGHIKQNFMTETIATNLAGGANIQHVFEWGERQGETSSVPLFMLVKGAVGNNTTLGYEFLPSTKYVPLPDPSRYGFAPSKIADMRRHIFQLKAVVMETRQRVKVAPQGAKRLFIPDESAKRGYYMSSSPTYPNPGGKQATGGFASWWNQWFGTRAEVLTKEIVEETEAWLVLTGRKYVRYAAGTVINGVKVGGRFASGKGVSVGYVNSKARMVKKQVLADSERHFDSDLWESTWSD